MTHPFGMLPRLIAPSPSETGETHDLVDVANRHCSHCRVRVGFLEQKEMTKEEALQAIKLLSALESWAMSQSARLPDYVHEDLCKSMEVLERIVLEEKP
jgi:hypothetical protein